MSPLRYGFDIFEQSHYLWWHRNPIYRPTMSSTQEYKEARVQYWEEMLGFEYNTNSTKFRAFTACKALCDHVDAMKISAAYYNTDYQISHSKALRNLGS